MSKESPIPQVTLVDIIQDYDGNEIFIGDKLVLVNGLDLDPVLSGPIQEGDEFIAIGGDDDNIVHVVSTHTSYRYGFFGERFSKVF